MRTPFNATEKLTSEASEKAGTETASRPSSPSQLACLQARAAQHKLPLAIKRIIDVIGSTLGLLLLAPVFVVIALAVKLQDGGPVIYRRRVVGRKGEFDAFKFRSMRSDADRYLQSNPVLWAEFQRDYKLKNDPRVTRVGQWLRKTSLDELPQLWNVLRGEMSLVGPRMITAAELEKYGDMNALFLTIRPGITGYWQVSGRQDVSYQRRVEMDRYYVENWSLALDLKILLKTLGVVVTAKGAY